MPYQPGIINPDVYRNMRIPCLPLKAGLPTGTGRHIIPLKTYNFNHMKFKILLIVVLACLAAACHTHNQDGGHEHVASQKYIDENPQVHDHEHEAEQEEAVEHEHEKNQYTVYTGSYELFAEADAFVVGEQANILAHFTKLPSFKPLESGSVTVVLSVSGYEVAQTLEEPTRTGIYSFDLTPTAAGTGTLRFMADTAEIAVTGIRVYSDHNEAHKHEDHQESSMVNKIAFTKEQSWKIDFKTEPVKQEPFGQVIKTVAKIQPDTGNEKMVAAKTNGIVLFSNNNLIEGREVAAGQTLLRITSGGMSDNNIAVRVTEARNNFENAEADYMRKKELAEDRIISEKELLEAKTAYENARAVYENYINNFSEGAQSITSPMQGFVKQVFVTNGQYVEAGQTLVSVSQNQSLILHAFVQQQYSGILAGINSANIKTLYDNQSYTFEELNGKVLSYGKSVNDENYLIPVSLQIDNKAGFVQGSLIEVYLKTLTNSQATLVPASALLEEQGNYFVFVQETPELFEKRQVKKGATDGIDTEILSGLLSGERVISEGATLVKLAQASGALDPHSGHVH